MKSFLHKSLIRNNSKEFLYTNVFFGGVTLLSVLSIALETIDSLSSYTTVFIIIEYFAVTIFSLEYLARLYIHEERLKYMVSFIGIIDLIAILPSLAGITNLTFLKAARIVRVIAFLRTIRLAKLARLKKFSNNNSKKAKEIQNISVRIYAIVLIAAVVVFGFLLYILEGDNTLFSNIPLSILWTAQAILGGNVETSTFSITTKVLVIGIQFTGLLLFGLLVHLVGRFVEKHLLGSSSIAD